VVTKELHVRTVGLEVATTALRNVLLAAKGCEAPVLGDDDLLAAGELVLRPAEGFNGGGTVGISGSDTQENLADVDTGNLAVGLSESTTHTGLESIGSSARQHLVDADDMVRVDTNTEMESFLSSNLHEVLVGANTSGFEGFG